MARSARHTAILAIVTVSGCLAAFGGWRFAKASAPVNGPIVLISIDSLRADRLPAYGYEHGRTPAIDALAADGIVFERAYAHVPQTLPAHAALLTGRLPFETGVRDAAGSTLPSSARTIADLLKDRGYATGGIVSSFLLRKETGIATGFSFFDAELPAPDAAAPDAWLMRDGAASEKVAENWLDSIGTSRAFLFLHVAEPHAPYAAPERFTGLSAYDAEVAYADEVVGCLVRYLKAHQLYDRATIVLVSDHGEGLGDGGEQTHGLLTSDSALHIPLIVKQPGGDGGKRRVSVPVQQVDLVPTMLDLAKAPGAGGLRGRSLTPLFGSGSIAAAPIYSESLYAQYRFGWDAERSLIDGRYQLVTRGASAQLFDLEVAPASRTNLAAEKPDVVNAMKARLAEVVGREAPLTPTPVTPTDRERYEALGYIGVPGSAAVAGAEQPDAVTQVAFVERYRAAVQVARSERWRDAIDAYRTLTTEQPSMSDLWMHLASTAARQERHDVALDAYGHALALDPANLAGHLGAAASYLRVRKLDESFAEATAVVDLETADSVQKAEAHELLARVALSRKDAEVAQAEAVASETADPNRPVRAFVEGRLALDQGHYAEAVDAFERALAAAEKAGRPPLTDLRVYAAEALVRAERAADAERLLSAELSAFPANVRARTALQALYRASGRSQDAAALAQH
ncbi:MAG: sulfatase-like hydrolase/transferase [Vicinamibacterales bacterium]